MCRKERNQRWRQHEETSLITGRRLVLQEVLYGAHLKDVSRPMTHRIVSQMLLCLVHTTAINDINFVDPTTSIWLCYLTSQTAYPMSDCVCTLSPRVAKYQKLVSS